ncbi:long-chain fatty acid--CoA ligase [Ramlibacter henchirensis]|uniref:Long-chain fatty acid--CoA ligase n=1 Tax=Ramlibacter henchirensis TaxID=204072 RepID=A0A4Z0BWA5_9BURK|nr:long-chain-fatty-acid--CoA ligase [Ramlibacter henchirensis]TFZ02640.1 long-chain fatty acid--CoA ligase [Ramlibacter henchirensis]
MPTSRSSKAVAARGGATSYWPRHLPRHLEAPDVTLSETLATSARRFADRAAIHSFGRSILYSELADAVERFAGWLVKRAGVRRGDRVLLYMQNSAQWVIAYHGVLRADAVVVPINPMNRGAEVAHYLKDSGACVAVCAQDLVEQLEAASAGTDLRQIIVATYSDYVDAGTDWALPDWLREPRRPHGSHVTWADALAAGERPGPPLSQPGDLCLLPYTSGSTGVPRACMHTHRSFMHNAAGMALWHWTAPATAFLCVAPMYHVAGLSHSLNLPIYVGGTLVVLPRWERDLALRLLAEQRVGHAAIPPTAVIDLLGHPQLDQYDLGGLRRITAGGASMPMEVWKRLRNRLGLDFIEGYGMTETAATTHNNPIDRPKRQCLGVPFFDTLSLVIDPATLRPLPAGEQGEILVSGPQLFQGYWNRPQDTADAFVEIDGVRYLRTGDIGQVDEEGYFFMTDRAKRMINASGYKVWPAEVESVLYQHPAIREVCVIGSRDPYRGETVKALVVLDPKSRGSVGADDIISWARERMAAYKYPRIVEFTESLPKSPVGKILWRDIQEAESART